MVLTLGACTEKAPEYEPAEAAGTAEVYFVPGQPVQYNLKELDGSFDVTLCRVVSTNALTVNLTSTADALFTIPSSVTFDSGSKEAVLTITYDNTAIEEDATYPVSIKINDNTSPYGNAEYAFEGIVPAAWEIWGKGTLYEDPYWGEEEVKTLYYQDITDEIRLCKFSECFGHDTIAAGNEYPVQDYVFYWNTTTNALYVPVQWMGYENDNGKTYFSDEPAFYNQLWAMKNGVGYGAGSMGPGAGQVEGTPEWFEFCDAFRAAYPEDYYPYYDGNGGFYLADQYIAGDPSDDKAYLGRYTTDGFSDGFDYFIADGFVRTVDYNDEKHLGASSALYEGEVESMIFSSDGENPGIFDASMRYDADYELEEDDTDVTTTYYIPEYFGDEHCLAFTAPVPELLEDGSVISGVENQQTTGIILFGNEVYVTVKKGSVSWPEDEEFPVFSIVCVVDSRTTNADGELEVVHNFGQWTEVYTANDYGKDFYTTDDLYGGYFEDYLGAWTFHSTDFSDGLEYYYSCTIEDDGKDDAGIPWVKITNLSGYNGAFGGTLVDEIYAYWNNGYLFVPGMDLENEVTISGEQYVMGVYPWDPDTDTSYGQSNAILAGICNDGNLAFVNRFSGVNLLGFNYYIDGLGYLTKIYNIWAEREESSSVSRSDFFEPGPVEVVKSNGFREGKKIGNITREAVSSKSIKAQRVINLQPVTKVEKNQPSLSNAPLK